MWYRCAGRWWQSLDRWQQTAIVVWAVILLVIGLRALTSRAESGSVYPIFIGGARNWWDGKDLYQEYAGLDHFRYSPAFAVFLTPFLLFSDLVGGLSWRCLNAAVFLGALAWWSRTALPALLTSRQQGVLFLLVIPLSIGSLNNGQMNGLMVGLLLASLAAVSEGRWNIAAECLAVATLMKVYPLALGLLLVLAYPRQFGIRWGIALGVGLALPFLTQRPDYVIEQYGGWLSHLHSYDRGPLPLILWYRDFRLLCHVWGMPLSSAGYLAIQLITAVGAAATCLLAQRANWPPRRLLSLVGLLGCGWMTVFGPATESCTYILLAPALAAVMLESWQGDYLFGSKLVVLGSYALFTAAALANWFPGGRAFHALAPQPLAGLLLLIAGMTLACHSAKGTSRLLGEGGPARLAGPTQVGAASRAAPGPARLAGPTGVEVPAARAA